MHVGKSPYTDPYLITKLLSLRLPLYPNLQIQLTTKLAPDLTNDLLGGSLDLAFLANAPETSRLTGRLLSALPFYVVMSESDPLSVKKEVSGNDLTGRSCILFERHVQPRLYDEVNLTLQPAPLPGCSLHHVMTAEDAVQLVLRGSGLALLTQAGAWRVQRRGVTIRPPSAGDLIVRTQLVARSDERSKVVSDLVRSLVKAIFPGTPPRPMQLLLPT